MSGAFRKLDPVRNLKGQIGLLRGKSFNKEGGFSKSSKRRNAEEVRRLNKMTDVIAYDGDRYTKNGKEFKPNSLLGG